MNLSKLLVDFLKFGVKKIQRFLTIYSTLLCPKYFKHILYLSFN